MKSGLRKAVSFAFLLLAGTLAGLAGWQFGPRVLAHFQPAPVARTLPDLVLPDLQGQAQSLQQWRGKILVINLWAAWCPPCRMEMPGFSRLQEKFASADVQFVGVALDDRENVVDFVRKNAIRYPQLLGDRPLQDAFADLGNRSQSLPFTAIFTPDGQLRHIHRGYWREDELDGILGELAGMKAK